MNDLPHNPHRLRSIGFLLFGSSCLCGLIAYEKYRIAAEMAQAFSEAVAIDGLEFKVSVPTETYVASFFCVLLGAAAIRCFVQWYVKRKPTSDGLPLIP